MGRRAEKKAVAWFATARRSESPGKLPSYTGRYLARVLLLMKALVLCFFLVASAIGADSRLEGARQALDDGLPQVAIYRLRQALGKKLPKEDQTTAEMLLAQALFAAGRYDENASLLGKMASGAESRFWLAQTYAALDKPAKALPLYQALSRETGFAAQAAVGAAKMLVRIGSSFRGGRGAFDLPGGKPLLERSRIGTRGDPA